MQKFLFLCNTHNELSQTNWQHTGLHWIMRISHLSVLMYTLMYTQSLQTHLSYRTKHSYLMNTTARVWTTNPWLTWLMNTTARVWTANPRFTCTWRMNTIARVWTINPGFTWHMTTTARVWTTNPWFTGRTLPVQLQPPRQALTINLAITYSLLFHILTAV